jgi:hypothetical protein
VNLLGAGLLIFEAVTNLADNYELQNETNKQLG